MKAYLVTALLLITAWSTQAALALDGNSVNTAADDSGQWAGGASDLINMKKVPRQIQEGGPGVGVCKDSQGRPISSDSADYEGCERNAAEVNKGLAAIPQPIPTHFNQQQSTQPLHF